MKYLLVLAALAAPLLAGPFVTSEVTFNSGTGLYHYNYLADHGDTGGNVYVVGVSLPYAGEPDYLPLNIVNMQDWKTLRDDCGFPLGTGCWVSLANGPSRGPLARWQFDTGYAPVAGYILIGAGPGSAHAVLDVVPNYDNSLVEDPSREANSFAPEPSSLLLLAAPLLALARRLSV